MGLSDIWQKESKGTLIKMGSPIPQYKAISFKDKTEPFQVIARYSDDQKLPADTEPFLGRWIVSNIPVATHPSNEGKPPKIKLNFQLDLNGIFAVSSVTSIERWEIEVEEEVKVEIKPEKDEAKDTESPVDKDSSDKKPVDSSEAPSTEPTKNDEQPQKSSGTSTTTTTETAADQPANEDSEKAKEKPKDDKEKSEEKTTEETKPKYRTEKVKKMVTKRNKVDLPVKEEFIPDMDESSFQIWRKEELTMIAKDIEIIETEEIRNSLEGYVLQMRGKLEGELKSYMKDTAREKFLKELNDMELWLEEDGYDAEKAAFEERLKNLRVSGDPVTRRLLEAKKRPATIKAMHRALAESRALAQSKDKKYDHIPPEDREKAMKKCKETEEWLQNEIKKQDPLTLADDPVVLCDAIEEKEGDTRRYCLSIMNKPKPEPKKKKEKGKAKDKGKEKNDSKDETTETTATSTTSSTTDAEDGPPMDLGCD